MKVRNILFILLVALLYSCDSNSSDEKVLTYAWGLNAGPINPQQTSGNQMYAQAMIYEPLVKYGDKGKILPWLAESWELSSSGKEYIFRLREGVTFSNGEKFNAQAVKLNFNSLIINREKLKWLNFIRLLDSTEVVSELEIKIRLTQAYSPLLQELTLVRPVRFIAPSSIPENGNIRDGIKTPIGTGPWKLESTILGVEDVFVVNENYWGDKPKIDKVITKIIPDPNSRAIALETGEIDLVYGKGGELFPDTFYRFTKDSRFYSATSIPFNTRAIAMNTQNVGIGDIAVRRAINHLVDKELFIDEFLYGTEKVAPALFDSSVPYCNVGLEPYEFSVDKANDLLDKAGWRVDSGKGYRTRDGKELNFDLIYIGKDAIMKSIAEFVQASLMEAGIKVNLVAEEASIFYKRQKDGSFDLIFNNTWGIPYDPHVFMSGMRRAGHADYEAQRGLERKDELDGLITEALNTTNEQIRKDYIKEVLTELHEQAVYLPFSYQGAIAVAGDRLKPFEMVGFTNITPFEDMELKE